MKLVSVDGKAKLEIVDNGDFLPQEGCDVPTLGFAFVEAPDQLAVRDPKDVGSLVYPVGRRIVLRTCSLEDGDGVVFSGEFADAGDFGNSTPEAPLDGYTKELPLPLEWFLERQNAIVYYKLGGLYGKLIVFGDSRFLASRVYPIEERPFVQNVAVYNPTGSRSLRTTYRKPQ